MCLRTGDLAVWGTENILMSLVEFIIIKSTQPKYENITALSTTGIKQQRRTINGAFAV